MKTIDFSKIQNIVNVKNGDKNGRSGSSITTSKDGGISSQKESSANSLQRKLVTAKEDGNHKKFPMSGEDALRIFASSLNAYEREEIKHF